MVAELGVTPAQLHTVAGSRMSGIPISDELTQWAARAGYALTPVDHSGAALFWTDPGGEIRLYIRGDPTSGYSVTSAERSRSEQFGLHVASLAVAERYLFDVFGSSIRSRKRLPRITIEHISADGYALGDADDDGYRRLIGPGGVVATARGRIQAKSTLTLLSQLVDASVPDIEASYGDPDGRPLFAK
jgi:hypothetical protein